MHKCLGILDIIILLFSSRLPGFLLFLQKEDEELHDIYTY